MAYVTTNPPIQQSMGPLTGGPNRSETGDSGGRLWLYNSPDVTATVTGAGYITNAAALGMQLGDIVFVRDSTTPHNYIMVVSAISAAGAATLVSGATLL